MYVLCIGRVILHLRKQFMMCAMVDALLRYLSFLFLLCTMFQHSCLFVRVLIWNMCVILLGIRCQCSCSRVALHFGLYLITYNLDFEQI